MCTGYFYEQWRDEEPPTPINLTLTLILIVVQSFFGIVTFIFKWRGAKPSNVPFNHQNHNITNMKSYANIIFVCAAIYVFSFILQRR